MYTELNFNCDKFVSKCSHCLFKEFFVCLEHGVSLQNKFVDEIPMQTVSDISVTWS